MADSHFHRDAAVRCECTAGRGCVARGYGWGPWLAAVVCLAVLTGGAGAAAGCRRPVRGDGAAATPVAERDPGPAKRVVRAADGVDIVCETRGRGDTALVFLHGWCGDRTWWKHQVDAFAGDNRVVTVDQAGHG